MSKKNNSIILFCLLLLIISVLGCSKTEVPDKNNRPQPIPIEKLLYSKYQIKIPTFNDPLLTKAQNDVSVTPEWNKIRKSKSGNTSVIPLKMNKKVSLYSSKKEYGGINLKAFLVIKNRPSTKSGGDDNGFVVMTNDDDTEEGSGDDGGTAPGGNAADIQFVSISTLNGNILYAMVFVDGFLEYLIMPSVVPIIDPNFEADPNFSVWLAANDQNDWFLSIDGGAYCIAYKPSKKKSIDDISNWGIVTPNPDNMPHIDIEVSSPDDNTSSPSDEDYGFYVLLSVSPENSGRTVGGAYYPHDIETITIQAIANPGYKFLNWSGYFAGQPQSFSYNTDYPQSTIIATANFERIPCRDIQSGKSSPLVNLALAPPNQNIIGGALWGSQYRKNVDGSPKHHQGIDFATYIGEPVYSMFDGVVLTDPVVCQPNRDGDDYPPGYNGDKNAAGNRIRIASNVVGNNLIIAYWHLQPGGTINPNTGQFYKSGDIVKVGDIIGYAGITGNANPSLPHLHLTIIKNGAEINPQEYIYGIISATTTTIITNCGN